MNYRGVNLSEGEYDQGVGEVEDARAALSWLLGRYPHLPYSLAGFSFGSRIVLKLGCELGHAERIVAAGFPTIYPYQEFLRRCIVPRVFIQSTHDEYGPRPALEAVVRDLPEPKRLIWVEARDHFFGGGLDQFEGAVRKSTAAWD
jgi:alpha/beta superfamily hydrolase